MPFCFQSLIDGKQVSICWFLTFYCLKQPPKTQNISKFIKEQEIFFKWTVDGVQHQFNKNWLDKDLFIKNRTSTVVTLVLFWFDFL